MQRLTSPGSEQAGKRLKKAANELGGERREGYRSIAPTAHQVAADRPDSQHATSIQMRTLETPLELQEIRLASFLNAVQELKWNFRCQEMPDEVHIDVDSDQAQCPLMEVSWFDAHTYWTAAVSTSTREPPAAPRRSCMRS